MRHTYKLLDSHNGNRTDKNGRYLRASPGIPPFDINESRPAQQCAASLPVCAAYRANAAHESNHGDGIGFQDSSEGLVRREDSCTLEEIKKCGAGIYQSSSNKRRSGDQDQVPAGSE